MTDIRILKPGDENLMEAFLLPRIHASMFLIGNSRLSGLEDHGKAYQGTYAAVFERDAITAVAAHYWSGMLVLQAPEHTGELADAAIAASRRSLGGLIGPGPQVQAARDHLDLKKEEIRLDNPAYLYSLELQLLQIPGILASGRVRGRRIEPGDIDLVTEWETAYCMEELGGTDSPQFRENCRRTVEAMVRERRGWILESDGRSVARTAFNTAIKESVQVGGVWTPPELRSRGYARAAVAFSLLDARKKGVSSAVLFTGEENFAAHRAYEALGFRRTGDYRLLFLKDGG